MAKTWSRAVRQASSVGRNPRLSVSRPTFSRPSVSVRFATDGHEDSVRRVLARLAAVGVVRGDANAAVVGP